MSTTSDTGPSPSVDILRDATPEALALALHTLITCEVCAVAEAETPPCLGKYCLTGQGLFLSALRANAARRKATRAAEQASR